MCAVSSILPMCGIVFSNMVRFSKDNEHYKYVRPDAPDLCFPQKKRQLQNTSPTFYLPWIDSAVSQQTCRSLQ